MPWEGSGDLVGCFQEGLSQRLVFDVGEALLVLPVPLLGTCKKLWIQQPSEVAA